MAPFGLEMDMDAESILLLLSLIVAGAVVLLGAGGGRKKRIIGPPPPPPEKKAFTVDELSGYKGRWGGDVLLACKGIVYHVDPTHYGPGAGYSVFAGKDVSRHLGKMKVGDEEANREWQSLNEQETTIMDDWEAKFQKKYEIWGWLEAGWVQPPVTKEMLDAIPCPSSPMADDQDPIMSLQKETAKRAGGGKDTDATTTQKQ